MRPFRRIEVRLLAGLCREHLHRRPYRVMVLDDPERNLLAANFNGAMTYEMANHGIALRSSSQSRALPKIRPRGELSIYLDTTTPAAE